jgi:FkbM family methyltransferase
MISVAKKFFWDRVRSFLRKRKSFLYHLACDDIRGQKIVPESLVLRIQEDTILGKQGETIAMPYDASIVPDVLATGGWQENTHALFLSHTYPGETYDLVDIGANIGLFSRQILNAPLSVVSATCVEPSKKNFSFLQQNLNFDHVTVRFHNVALGAERGSFELFKDDSNFGNYSLNPNAIAPNEPHSTELVQVEPAGSFLKNLQKSGDAYLIKIDTQGNDELIVASLPQEILNRTRVLMFEMWNIKEKSYDYEAFLRAISSFEEVFVDGQIVSSVDHLRYTVTKFPRFHADIIAVHTK